MEEKNPRWDPGCPTGIYYHKKFAKIALSESPVGCRSENSPVSEDSEEQKRFIKVYQTNVESGDNKMITLNKINPEIARTTLEVRLSMNMNMNF